MHNCFRYDKKICQDVYNPIYGIKNNMQRKNRRYKTDNLPVEEFFVKYEKTINDFKTAGGKLDKSEKKRYLIQGWEQTLSKFSRRLLDVDFESN